MRTLSLSSSSVFPRAAFAALVIGATASARAEHDSTERIDVWETNRVETGAIDSGYLDLCGGIWTQAGGSSYFNVQATVGLGHDLVYENKIRKQEMNVNDGEFLCRRLVIGLANNWTYPAEVNVTGGTLRSHHNPASGDKNWVAYALALAPRSYVYMPRALDGSAWPAARLTMDGGHVAFPALTFGALDRSTDDTGYAWRSSAQVRLRGGTLELGEGGARTSFWDDESSYYDFNLSGGTLKLSAPAEISSRTHLSSVTGGTTIEVPATATGSRLSGEVFGTGSFTKTGAGTLVLTGINSYTGRTEVAEGSVVVQDSSNDPVWTGDCFVGTAAGTQVTSWTNASGTNSWSFVYTGTLVDSEHGPSVSATTLNGHPTLSFDGKSSLFLTGNSAQPASESPELTLAAVVKIPSGTVGANSTNWIEATVIAGTSLNMGGLLRYGLAVNHEGKVGFGTSYSQVNPVTETIWSDTAINDGQAHVVIGTWKQGAGYTLMVDGVRKVNAATQMKTSVTGRTRLILGGSEQNKSALFTGELAELRLVPHGYTKSQCELLTKRLQTRYGLTETPASVTVPSPTAVWSADDLAGEPGTSVTSWKVGSWDFTSSLADAILKQNTTAGYVPVTAPKIAADKVNGHKLVSFNGTSDALALTGSAATPVSGANGLSLAFAVRFTRLGRGAADAIIGDQSLFFGQGIFNVNNVQTFGLGYSGCGKTIAGHFCRMDSNVNVGYGTTRSRQSFLDDGEVHIIVATWPNVSETADKIHLSVDGEEADCDARMRYSIAQARILLGASEWKLMGEGGVARYVPVDVAEFRIFKNVVLTQAQRQKLTAEMAAKYGVLTAFDRAVTGEYSKSREVLVRADATYGARIATECFEVAAGQTVDCRGKLQGRPVVRADGALMTGSTAALTVNGLELEDGAVLRVRASADGTIQPIVVNGDLRLPNGTVKIDVSACGDKEPFGKVLSWTGNLVRTGTTQFEVIGSGFGNVRFDETNKWLKVGQRGVLLLVR